MGGRTYRSSGGKRKRHALSSSAETRDVRKAKQLKSLRTVVRRSNLKERMSQKVALRRLRNSPTFQMWMNHALYKPGNSRERKLAEQFKQLYQR